MEPCIMAFPFTSFFNFTSPPFFYSFIPHLSSVSSLLFYVFHLSQDNYLFISVHQFHLSLYLSLVCFVHIFFALASLLSLFPFFFSQLTAGKKVSLCFRFAGAKTLTKNLLCVCVCTKRAYARYYYNSSALCVCQSRILLSLSLSLPERKQQCLLCIVIAKSNNSSLETGQRNKNI